MNIVVKEFIEDYIHLIDEQDWEHFFIHWYNEGDENGEVTVELFDILALGGFPNLKEDTKEIRIKIITQKLDDCIQDRWGKYYSRINTWYMEYSDIVSDLYNWLGFTLEELYDILNHWQDAGLTPIPEKYALEVEGM